MSRRARVLQFRIPTERRLKTLFADQPDQVADVQQLAARLTEVLLMLHRRAPARAAEFARGSLMLLDRALADVAAIERGQA
jgi:hypothetical protein